MDERDKVAERFRPVAYASGMALVPDGQWVRFSDYEALAARLAEVEAIAESRLAMIAELPTRAAYEAAESALARAREEQDAMVGAAIEDIAERASKVWYHDDAEELRDLIRALRPDAAASLARYRNAVLEEAADYADKIARDSEDDVYWGKEARREGEQAAAKHIATTIRSLKTPSER